MIKGELCTVLIYGIALCPLVISYVIAVNVKYFLEINLNAVISIFGLAKYIHINNDYYAYC